MGLQDKKAELDEYLDGDSDAEKLEQLKQFDAEELDEDILDDLGLDEETKTAFHEQLRALQRVADQYKNEAWEQLLQLLGAQHAVQLQRPGAWLSVEQLLQKAEDELARERQELAAAVAAKDDFAATVAAQEEELKQLRTQLEKLEGVQPHVTTSPQ